MFIYSTGQIVRISLKLRGFIKNYPKKGVGMIDSIHHLDEKVQFSNIKRYYINTPAINSRWS